MQTNLQPCAGTRKLVGFRDVSGLGFRVYGEVMVMTHDLDSWTGYTPKQRSLGNPSRFSIYMQAVVDLLVHASRAQIVSRSPVLVRTDIIMSAGHGTFKLCVDFCLSSSRSILLVTSVTSAMWDGSFGLINIAMFLL